MLMCICIKCSLDAQFQHMASCYLFIFIFLQKQLASTNSLANKCSDLLTSCKRLNLNMCISGYKILYLYCITQNEKRDFFPRSKYLLMKNRRFLKKYII